MQHYAENTMNDSQFQYNLWKQFIRPDELFQVFCRFCDEQREVKKWTSKAIPMSISKYIGIKAYVRARFNNVINVV